MNNSNKKDAVSNMDSNKNRNQLVLMGVFCAVIIALLTVTLAVSFSGFRESISPDALDASVVVEKGTEDVGIIEDVAGINDIFDAKQEDTNVETATIEQSETPNHIEAPVEEEYVDEKISSNIPENVDLLIKEEKSDPTEVIQYDIERLRLADKDMAAKYFGMSTAFNADNIADKIAAALISFVKTDSTSDTEETVIVHICTLDYTAMRNETNNKVYEATMSGAADPEKEAQKEVAKGIIEGKFDVHFNIPVTVKDNEVVITEEFKQALTGNWYHGVNTTLRSVECVHAEQTYIETYESTDTSTNAN